MVLFRQDGTLSRTILVELLKREMGKEKPIDIFKNQEQLEEWPERVATQIIP